MNIGAKFIIKHAAGETLFAVHAKHRDPGYYECVAKKGISGTHHFLGSIEIFDINTIKSNLI